MTSLFITNCSIRALRHGATVRDRHLFDVPAGAPILIVLHRPPHLPAYRIAVDLTSFKQFYVSPGFINDKRFFTPTGC